MKIKNEQFTHLLWNIKRHKEEIKLCPPLQNLKYQKNIEEKLKTKNGKEKRKIKCN